MLLRPWRLGGGRPCSSRCCCTPEQAMDQSCAQLYPQERSHVGSKATPSLLPHQCILQGLGPPVASADVKKEGSSGQAPMGQASPTNPQDHILWDMLLRRKWDGRKVTNQTSFHPFVFPQEGISRGRGRSRQELYM